MNFDHDSGSVASLLTIDTTQSPPLGGSNTLQIVGTGGLVIPSGTTAERPNGVPAGTQRWNTTIGSIETYDGATWVTDLGGSVTSVTVASANSALTVTDPTVTDSGTVTLTVHPELVSLAGIDPNAEGPVVRQADGSYVTREVVGTDPVFVTNGDGLTGNPTISVNAELAGLAQLSNIGVVYHSGAGTYVEKTLAVAGNLTLDHVGDTLTFGYSASGNIAGLDSMSGTGVVTRTVDTSGSEVFVTRALEGTAGRTVVTNGDFVSGNAAVDLDQVTPTDSGVFVKVAVDAYGRVSGTTAVTTSDITDLVDSAYVSVSGDSMTGNLAFGGIATVIGLSSPVGATDAATKGYVDSLLSGLNWMKPVVTLSATPLPAPSIGDRYLNTSDSNVYTYTTTGWEAVTPADGAAVFAQDSDTGYVYTGAEWVQFTGTGQIAAGVGLSKDGNILNANLGAGIAQLPTDEIGIELRAGSALFLTEDGSTDSTGTDSQLALRVGSGLAQDSTSGVYIPTSGVTLDHLADHSYTFTGTSGSTQLDLGSSLAVVGELGGAITTVASANTLTISVPTATDSVAGVAKFDSTTFTVAGDGAVALTADLEDLTNINTASKGNGDLLSWSAGTSTWVAVPQIDVAPSLSLDDLTDVTLTGPVVREILQYTGAGVWVNVGLGSDSNIQEYSVGLSSIAALSATSATGFVAATATGEFTPRSLVAGTGIEITGDIATSDITIANTGVTSVGLDLPSIFDVTGSPVTSTGTLTASLVAVAANTVFAGPTSGADATPVFRELVPADIGLALYKENSASATAPTATGDNAVAVGSGSAASRAGEFAHSSGSFSSNGDAQSIEVVVRGTTSDATVVELFANSGQRVDMIANSALTFTVQVIGLRTDGVAAAGYRFDGVIYRGATESSTTFIGTPSKNILGETSPAYDAAVVADASYGALKVEVTGPASAAVRWVATIRATQVIAA